MHKTIEELRELLKYDPLTGQIKWLRRDSQRTRMNSIAGTQDKWGYIKINVKRTIYRAHRLAWALQTGSWPTEDIDHKNGIRNDNRWSNLRLATRSQNCMNSQRRHDNTSGHKNVSWCKIYNKWVARVRDPQTKSKKTKYCTTLEEAITEAKRLRELLHGAYACHR